MEGQRLQLDVRAGGRRGGGKGEKVSFLPKGSNTHDRRSADFELQKVILIRGGVTLGVLGKSLIFYEGLYIHTYKHPKHLNNSQLENHCKYRAFSKTMVNIERSRKPTVNIERLWKPSVKN